MKLTPTQREEIRKSWNTTKESKFYSPRGNKVIADHWLSVIDQELAKRETYLRQELEKMKAGRVNSKYHKNYLPTHLVLALLTPSQE